MDRDFKGIWIPKEIWLNKNLTTQEKLFLVEISSLDNKDGCYANNNYFANFFDISTTRVSIIINSLVQKGLITSQINVCEGNKRILKTLANIPYIPSQTIVKDPRKHSLIHNNTVNNPINNSINKVLTDFDKIWNLYKKKVGDKLKIQKKISTLGPGEILLMIDHIPKYVRSTPDPKYRKNLETYINNKSWNDEIIYSKPNNNNSNNGATFATNRPD